MSRSVGFVASQGAFLQQKRLFNVVSNNLSNAQTVGYKMDVPIFHTVLSQSRTGEEVKTMFTQGPLRKTENPLDLAVEGEGFFKVTTPNGIRYTRAGNFILGKDRVLRNADGFPVLGKKGEIRLQGRNTVIEKDGTVKVDGRKEEQVALVTFPDLGLLRKEGHSLFRLESPQEEIEVDDSQTIQGALESSNVNLMREMVNLMDSLRSYEACLKLIQSHDELNGKAANDLGKV